MDEVGDMGRRVLSEVAMALTSMLDRVRECYCYRGGWSSGDVGRCVWRRTAAAGTINGLVRTTCGAPSGTTNRD